MIYGNGKQTRDFINIKDVVEANVLALSKHKVAGEIFNICTGKTTTINNLALTIQKIMKKTDIKPVHTEPRHGDIKQSYGDITKARKNLGYNPKVQLEKGLIELINSYSKQ
jgi:UDP-glucose 4-epimerase